MALEQIYLCNTALLKEKTFINKNVEDSILKVAMIRTQDLHIEPLLGTVLFKKVLADIKAGEIAGDYATLLEKYVLPCFFAYVEHTLAPHLNTEIRNKAVGKSGDQDIRPASEQELNYILDRYFEQAEKYRSRLVAYLCDNKNLFPELSVNTGNKEDLPPTQDDFYPRTSFLL